MRLIYRFLLFVLFSLGVVNAQEDTTRNVLNDIQVDIKSVKAQGDTLVVDLFLISYQRNPREFKLNTYATQVTDREEESHLFSSIKMGRVQIRLEDKQNYLHYLLEEDVPVLLSIKFGDWPQNKKPAKLHLVFEDSSEEGKFVSFIVNI